MSVRDHILRRASLVLLILWVAVLAASFAHRQVRRRSTALEVEPTPATRQGDERPVRLHSGLVYTDTIGIEPNFRLAARETLEFASGWYELKDIEVSIFHTGEVAYGLVASEAKYNPQLREAHAHGNAQLSLSKGVALRADGFDLRGADRSFKSRGPVTFAAAGWGGVAGTLSGNAVENTIELGNNVTASWRGGGASAVTVLTPQVIYDRRRAVVELKEGVTLLHQASQVVAGSAGLRLRGAEGPPEQLVLAGGVAVTSRLGDGSVVEVSGQELELLLAPGGGVNFRVHPREDTGWVAASWQAPAGGWRKLSAWRVVGAGSQAAGLQWLEGQGLVCLEELEAAGAVHQQVLADSLRVEVVGGRAESATAWGNVRIQAGSQWGEGDRLVATMATRLAVLMPVPRGRVRFGATSLEGKSERLEWVPQQGLIAEGSVGGIVARGKVVGGEEGPAQFAAARAQSSPDGSVLILEGDARLWQGERLVRADRLEYRTAEELVVARGNVVTVGPGPRRTSEERGGVVRITARSLSYDARTTIATFEGDVRIVDEQTEVAAQRVTATFAPAGGLLLALLEGGLAVRERASGRAVIGQRAQLMGERDELQVWGDPVLLTEPNGNQLKAANLVWRRQEGVVTVSGGANSPSEALYHSAQPVEAPHGPGRPPRRTPSTQ